MGCTLARSTRGTALSLLALVFASCGGSTPVSGTGGTSTTAVQNAYLTQVSASVSKSQPAQASLGSQPDLGAFDAVTYISNSGLIAASEPDGTESDIFMRTKPSDAWYRAGSVPGLAYQIDFPSSEYGFVLARKSQDSALRASELYSTSDGGKTWHLASTGGLAKIYFFDSHNGVALFSSASATSKTVVMLTSDGGRSWHQARSNPFSHIPTFAAAFSFISPKMGWLAIGNQPSAGSELKYLYKTNDGGQTWAEVASPSTSGNSPPSESGGLPEGGYLDGIAFVSPSIGYMTLGRIRTGTELETTDGGAQWQSVDLGPNGSNGNPRTCKIRSLIALWSAGFDRSGIGLDSTVKGSQLEQAISPLSSQEHLIWLRPTASGDRGRKNSAGQAVEPRERVYPTRIWVGINDSRHSSWGRSCDSLIGSRDLPVQQGLDQSSVSSGMASWWRSIHIDSDWPCGHQSET